jgi:hypothetical protein
MARTVNYSGLRYATPGASFPRGGMPQDGLAPDFWSYFPSLAPDGCSIRLLYSDTLCSNIGRSITISIMMSAAVNYLHQVGVPTMV